VALQSRAHGAGMKSTEGGQACDLCDSRRTGKRMLVGIDSAATPLTAMIESKEHVLRMRTNPLGQNRTNRKPALKIEALIVENRLFSSLIVRRSFMSG